jgi:hypothetical protein
LSRAGIEECGGVGGESAGGREDRAEEEEAKVGKNLSDLGKDLVEEKEENPRWGRILVTE